MLQPSEVRGYSPDPFNFFVRVCDQQVDAHSPPDERSHLPH